MIIVVLFQSVILSGCEYVQKNFQIDVVLLVDGELASGSAVWEVVVWDGPDLFYPYGPATKISAEAIEVRSKSGRTLYVLRRQALPPNNFRGAPSLSYGGKFIFQCLSKVSAGYPVFLNTLKSFEGACELSTTPVIVQFSNNLQPSSMEVVEYGENKSVEIESITVSIIKEGSTQNILRSLPWLINEPYGLNIITGSVDEKFESGYLLLPDQFYVVDFIKEHVER